MKALLLLLALALSAPTMAGVTGNGGGGVNENGVYKTFYSAGLYVSPQAESEIPGAELYTKTILSIAGSNLSTSKLLAAGLPIANRKFYKILESKMDAGVMERLLNEYARVVDQPVNNLTIFAITDIGAQVTYLLPTFYKLSENEQAAILFHEAYWILNPHANYSQVVEAESAFQKFIEAKDNDEYDLELGAILANLLNDATLPLKTAFKEDVRKQKTSSLVAADATIKLKNIFANNLDLCTQEIKEVYVEQSLFGNNKYRDELFLKCTLGSKNLQDLFILSRKYPSSLFLKELMRFVANGKEVRGHWSHKISNGNTQKALETLWNMPVKFEKAVLYNEGYYDTQYLKLN